MSPIMRLLLGVGALLAILIVVAVGLPSHVTVARSVVINAPESAVYPYLNTMRNFAEWSPWRIRDPKLQMAFSGPAEGKGAHVDWASEVKSIGTGSMEITESEPNRSIDLAVNLNGLEGTSYYLLAPSGSGSKLTWSFSYDTGPNPLKRWRGVMLDNLIGPEYNAGLQKLKARIEEERRPTAAPAIGVTPPPAATTAPQTPAAPPTAAAPAPDGGEAATPPQAQPPAQAATPATPPPPAQNVPRRRTQR